MLPSPDRFLHVNLATLTALAAVLVGMGEGAIGVPLAVAAAVALSVWLTDVRGWVRLNRTVASAAAVSAVAVALVRTRHLTGEALLLGIAQLLVAMQLILHFQAKDDRTVRQLALLSLLQAMVATLFNQGVWFALLLVVYLLVGLSAMGLMHFTAECRPARPAGRHRATRATAATLPAAVGREWFRRLGGVGLGSLAISVLLFFALPRLGQSAWRGAGGRERALVGFNDQMQLGELGEILESREEVLRARFVAAATNELFPIAGGVYLRGAALTRYERGRWSHPPDRAAALRAVEPDLRPERPPQVLQRLTIEPSDRGELFCVWPFEFAAPAAVRFDARSQRLLRSDETCGRRYSYELATSGLRGGRQADLIPCSDVLVDDAVLRRLRQTPDLPRLTALAEQWLAGSRFAAGDRVGRARRLESMLRDSGLFQYSLQGQDRNLQIDPIEDFVSEHRLGHCEYFATALALMLRSQGIPARVIVGYRSEEWNELGKFFQVRQLHAHAWVEAYLEPAHLPAELIRGEEHWEWSAGGWLRLDATPLSAEGPAGESLADRLAGRFGALQDWWSNYVMEMDGARQREAVYGPLVEAVKQVARNLSDPQWWQSQWQAACERLAIRSGAGRWAALVAAIAATVAAIAAAVWGVYRWRRRRRRASLTAPRRGVPAAAFFHRLERLLARRGVVRRPGQTHYEFARRAGRELAARGSDAQAVAAPEALAAAFYQVRFGRLPLDAAQAQAVEQALAAVQRSA